MSAWAVVLLALRSALAVVLVAAGAAKLVDVPGFVSTVEGLGLPRRWAHPGALVVATCELTVGTASMLGLWPAATNLAVFTMTLGFALVTSLAMRRGPHLRCRCFGALANSRFGPATLARSLLMWATAATVLATNGRISLQPEVGIAATVPLLLVLALFAAASAQAARTVEVVRRGTGRS